jgi:hypothetical protein
MTACDRCAREEARSKDVGEHPPMRGLDTAFPSVRLRLSLSTTGVGNAGHKASDGSSSAVTSPPPVCSKWGRCVVDYEACTTLPIAQTNPTSSHAIAVTATVSFLPRRRGLCISRTGAPVPSSRCRALPVTLARGRSASACWSWADGDRSRRFRSGHAVLVRCRPW